jgi:prevent-host-death family protein
MDLNEIKKIVEADGGKFIIVENGEPVMVITSFEEYKRKLSLSKNDSEKKDSKEIPEELKSEELKVEDLPL